MLLFFVWLSARARCGGAGAGVRPLRTKRNPTQPPAPDRYRAIAPTQFSRRLGDGNFGIGIEPSAVGARKGEP
ncbi:hypothetical protein BS78_01G065600 [Paspalum vaginatum]|nr:hypothetical protein BS78_01G065600 [Paspalum vaginatum]